MSSLAHIFRAYDIRGVADRDLTDELVTALGRAVGTTIRRRGGSTISVGRDCRTSGPRLHAALVSGLLSTGVDVLDVGVVPSPLLYFAVHHHGSDGGVEITGSHNPSDYNGFKLLFGTTSIHGEQIQALRQLIEARDFATGTGTLREAPVEEAYIADVTGRIKMGWRPLEIVVDGGNGAGGPAGVALLERLGVRVVPLHIPMDGTFPNHHPDPTVEANLADLIAAVRHHRADLGVAFDGDGDRIGVVDEQGRILWGDRLLIVLARDVLRDNPGAAIVGEVKCSSTLFDAITAAGGRPIMARVGHSLIKARMKEEDALLGGEMSGHFFYRHRWYGFDDALYTTARLLEILSDTDTPLSSFLADVPQTHVTPELRLPCPDDAKFAIVAEAVAHYSALHPVVDIDGARIDFGDGWGLIRASNTQPVIVLRAEAQDPERLGAIRAELEGFVADRSRV